MQHTLSRSGGPGSGVLPLLKGHDGRALVFEDGLVRMDADIKLISELACLDDSPSMAYLGSGLVFEQRGI